MKLMTKCILFFFCLLLLAGCSKKEPFQKSTDKNELLVSVTISLTDAMAEIIAAYKEVNPNTIITLNMDKSEKLAQQIQQGAPADVFLSADRMWMDMLDEQELIASGTRTNFAKNQLVLIAKKSTVISIETLDELSFQTNGKIAIGNPDIVPAGGYAKEALKSKGVWNQIQDQLVYVNDVRDILTYVQNGNTDFGFVYPSDIIQAKDVDVILKVADDLHDNIVYPAGVTSYSLNSVNAQHFISFLKSNQVKAILESHGFNHSP